MVEQCLAEELRTLFLFEHLTAEQLDTLCTQGQIETFPAGPLCAEGEPSRCLYVLIDGELVMTKRSGGVDIETIRTSQRGVYFGAWSAFVPGEEPRHSASVRLTKSSRLFVMGMRAFVNFVQAQFPMAVHLLEGISVGGRRQDQILGQREKLLTLGSMTATFTHLLSTPADATVRAVTNLREGVENMRHKLAMVAEGQFTPTALRTLVAIQDEVAEQVGKSAQELPVLEVSGREERLNDWLDDHGIIGRCKYAPTFVEAGLDVDWLERVSAAVEHGSDGGAEDGRENLNMLQGAVGWLKYTIDAELRMHEIADASRRISALLAGAKQYTQMDRASYQSADVHELLNSTLMMFGDEVAIAGEGRPITLVHEMDKSLPEILCYPGDLNQVWTNVIDNAVEAMDGHGTLTVRSVRENDDMIRIEICDDGPGISEDIIDRIFTPFFTTKPVGEGPGLGLDLAWRIVVTKHRGSLSVQSKPGETRFLIYLPLIAPPPEPPPRIAGDDQHEKAELYVKSPH